MSEPGNTTKKTNLGVRYSSATFFPLLETMEILMRSKMLYAAAFGSLAMLTLSLPVTAREETRSTTTTQTRDNRPQTQTTDHRDQEEVQAPPRKVGKGEGNDDHEHGSSRAREQRIDNHHHDYATLIPRYRFASGATEQTPPNRRFVPLLEISGKDASTSRTLNTCTKEKTECRTHLQICLS